MKIFYFLLLFSSVSNLLAQELQVTDLTCEYKDNPLGIDVSRPRFSWKLMCDQRGTMQTKYAIRVGLDSANLKNGGDVVWQSGNVLSDQSVLVHYEGPALLSRQRYFWQVKVSDNKGNTSEWSEVKFWETGLLHPSDWLAKWIEPTVPDDSAGQPPPLLRHAFEIKNAIQSARLYITSHGLYEAQLNGKRVGSQYLTPGWTSYDKRLQYQTYDVTSLIHAGGNAIGVLLGDGWYRGNIGWHKNVYGKNLGLLAQLEITFADGSTQKITTNEQWKCSTGAIRRAGIYYGESYDARLEKTGWTASDFDDSDWLPVRTTEAGKENLIASYGPPVRKHEEFQPVKIFKTPKGETVVDFGQNLVGWITLKVKGKPGDKITIEHAEVLDKHGNFYTENLRGAQAEIQYIVKGDGEEIYEPHLTFFGFRYVKVDGFPGDLTTKNLRASAVYSSMAPTGEFSSSNALLNQLQHNIQWGQKGNFVDVPTDCPQRDERLGWTGDAQVFSRTAAYNMNVATFFAKWLKDLAADQLEDGRVPFVIPNMLDKDASASTGWSDAATIIPWNMYMAFGDKRILEDQYKSMAAWVDYMDSESENNLWNTGYHFGDWLFYRPDDDNDGRAAVTDKYLIAQCFWAHSTQLLINTARVLGKTEDAAKYAGKLQRIKSAFQKEYLTPNGRLVSGTQTAYVLSLNFDMLPEDQRAQAAERLVQNVRDYGNHLTTGFLGTPYLCQVLTRFGHIDVAYRLLMQDTYPSWLYPVEMGATTIWERWDGMKPDSTFQTPGMNSFNHYAYGAIGDWMYRTVAGLQEASPGYKEVLIAPKPGGELTHASAALQTAYGLVKSSWELSGMEFRLSVQIPANTTATIVLPRGASAVVTEHGVKVEKLKAMTSSEKDGSDLKINVGSGSYEFKYVYN